jgi:hypothetical protein
LPWPDYLGLIALAWLPWPDCLGLITLACPVVLEPLSCTRYGYTSRLFRRWQSASSCQPVSWSVPGIRCVYARPSLAFPEESVEFGTSWRVSRVWQVVVFLPSCSSSCVACLSGEFPAACRHTGSWCRARISLYLRNCSVLQALKFYNYYELASSVVLVWVYTIRFGVSKKTNKS